MDKAMPKDIVREQRHLVNNNLSPYELSSRNLDAMKQGKMRKANKAGELARQALKFL